MKKLKPIIYTVITVLIIALSGCNDILEDVEPATSLSGETALTSPDGVDAIRASMYSKIHEAFTYTTDYFVGPSAFTDETRNRPGSTRFQALTTAVGTSGRDHIGGDGTWNDSYDIIQDTNLLISAVEEGVLEQETLDQYRGEAFAIRAFVYHSLARLYGYEPGMFSIGPEGSWDSGVIIRNEPVIEVSDADQRPRSSVTEVYNQIFSDLDQARNLLSGINDDNTYATEAFVDAVAARAHLYAGNWSEASAAAQAAISKFGGSLETSADGVADMFDENAGGHPEVIFKVVINPDTEGGGFGNTGPATYTADGFLAQLPTQFLLDKYSVDDYRWGWYRDCTTTQSNPLTTPTDCDGVNGNGLAIVKFAGEKGNSVDDMPMIRLAEMYLIWAEAAAKANNSPAAGLPPLQELRNARNAGAVPEEAITSMPAFEDFILDERMRELAVEGHRFFDLKRLGRDIRHPNGDIKMRADSYRILPPFGENLLSVNPQLVQNPNY